MLVTKHLLTGTSLHLENKIQVVPLVKWGREIAPLHSLSSVKSVDVEYLHSEHILEFFWVPDAERWILEIRILSFWSHEVMQSAAGSQG